MRFTLDWKKDPFRKEKLMHRIIMACVPIFMLSLPLATSGFGCEGETQASGGKASAPCEKCHKGSKAKLKVGAKGKNSSEAKSAADTTSPTKQPAGT